MITLNLRRFFEIYIKIIRPARDRVTICGHRKWTDTFMRSE